MSETITRAPKQIPGDAFDPKEEGRDYRLLSQAAYNYVRKIQLDYRLTHNHKKAFRGVLWKKDHPLLEHSVVIGDLDETIAIYDDAVVGRGAFGAVYAGVSCDTGKFHAIKVQRLNPDHVGHATDIKYEVRVLQDTDRLSDKLLVDDKDGIKAIICQDFAYGKNYFDTFFNTSEPKALRRNTLPFSEKLDMAIKALEEVDKLHKKNWLHCDLKLLNLMWDPINKQCKLIDFGTTRQMNKSKYHDALLAGTELYIAPEYLKSFYNNNTRFTLQGEAYALGMTLLQMFSNKLLTKSPRALTVAYINNKETKGVAPFIEDMFDDILGKGVKDKSLKRVATVIKSMLDIDAKRRPSLAKMIKTLKSVQKDYDKKIGAHDSASKPSDCVICNYKPKKYETKMTRHSEEVLRDHFRNMMMKT